MRTAWSSGLLESGVLDGLRIDHIDGLLDPRATCVRLREKAPRPILSRGREDPGAARERCARTGRSRAPPATSSRTSCSALLVDPAGEEGFTQPLRRFTGERAAVRATSCATASCASWRTRWRASSTCSPATPPGWRARTRGPPISPATSCSGRCAKSSPASRSTAPMSTQRRAAPSGPRAISTGRSAQRAPQRDRRRSERLRLPAPGC